MNTLARPTMEVGDLQSPSNHQRVAGSSSCFSRSFAARSARAGGDQSSEARLLAKVLRVLSYYGKLVFYAATARPKLFHILWNNKFEVFDRTLLMLYYRMLGKKITLTVHNVNAGKRDLNDSFLNRFSLRIQYNLCCHIFVHTER